MQTDLIKHAGIQLGSEFLSSKKKFVDAGLDVKFYAQTRIQGASSGVKSACKVSKWCPQFPNKKIIFLHRLGTFLYTWASFFFAQLPKLFAWNITLFCTFCHFVCKKKWAKMFVWCSKFSKKNWKHLFHLAPDISLQPPQPKLRQQLWCVVRIFVSNYFSYFWLISTKITIRSRQAEDHRTCSSFVFSASICGM